MEEMVRVRVTTVSEEETLHFEGSGNLFRDGRGLHLHYTVRNEDGHTVSAALHLGAGRALLTSDGSRLLLDLARPAAAHMGGGIPPLTVAAHRITHEEKNGSETIRLHYTLSADAQVLRDMRIRVEIEPVRREIP
ncbi:MAG: DUF1934 family protein [Oscillospiraceae bacterium]|nr:DUF1934 family protein [Oscillospiraceae bacterium]